MHNQTMKIILLTSCENDICIFGLKVLPDLHIPFHATSKVNANFFSPGFGARFKAQGHK